MRFPSTMSAFQAHYWLALLVVSSASVRLLVFAQNGISSGNNDGSAHASSRSTGRTSLNTDRREKKNTEDLYDIYDILKVRQPTRCPYQAWKRWSWKCHSRLLPLLHFGQGDDINPPDVFVNLRVLWNKALASLDANSPSNERMDHYPTFHLLPKLSRWILFCVIPIWMYPRWMHANIELRTVYLNQAMEKEINHILHSSNTSAIELIILGSGYDTLSIRTLIRYPQVARVWELDFDSVVQSKQKLVERMVQQVPQLSSVQDGSLRYLVVDLNDLDQVEQVLERIRYERNNIETHTIIVTEAVLMYLDEDKPAKIMQLFREQFGTNLSWLLVDRFKAMPPEEEVDDENNKEAVLSSAKQSASNFLASFRWEVIEWLIKPGVTRHMGIIRPFKE